MTCVGCEDDVKGLQWTPTPRVVFVNKGQMEKLLPIVVVPMQLVCFLTTQLTTLAISTSLPPVAKIECSPTTRLEESLTFQDQQCFT